MKLFLKHLIKPAILTAFAALVIHQSRAQTDVDAVMMSKNNLCTGFQYSVSSWDHYWEGKLKRTNENLGHVTTQMVGWMGNYGITNKLNKKPASKNCRLTFLKKSKTP
ncbi:MAG: hypothetical protein EOO01_26435 [Chitinophagaceae bacterium]|nr:MAG: hypothetical protein EOO01_26435 [Chitinophagaceae bacterium]